MTGILMRVLWSHPAVKPRFACIAKVGAPADSWTYITTIRYRHQPSGS